MAEAGDALGSIAIGSLVAREVERAHADAPALGHAIDEPCANCGSIRVGPYCHDCGQAGHVHRTPGALVHDIAHGVFHFEGKVWHTLPLLAWRPGELTRRYVHGERAKFVSPMALFLFSVFLMFAVVSNLAGAGHRTPGGGVAAQLGMAAELAKARTALATDEARLARIKGGDARATLDARIAEERKAVQVLAALHRSGTVETSPTRDAARVKAVDDLNVRTGWQWLDGSIRHAAENPDLLLYKMKSYGYKYSWALIPISLPFLWLLFAFRRDVGLYDHAIFAIYSLSFMSLGVVALTLLSLIGVGTAIIVLAGLLVPPLHMYRQLKGAYALGRFGAGWRTLALLVITTITSSLFLMLLFYLGSD